MASRSHDASILACALTKLILHEGRILTAYLAESLFVHVVCCSLYMRLHLSISFVVALISFLVLSITSSKRISNSWS